jgi:hypothetical protein
MVPSLFDSLFTGDVADATECNQLGVFVAPVCLSWAASGYRYGANFCITSAYGLSLKVDHRRAPVKLRRQSDVYRA